jgi:DNA polymerase I-like protein with 3'-5' exonuclease and polymerase domains
LEGPEQHKDEALGIVVELMRSPFNKPLLVDLVVDARAAKTWLDAK